MARSLLAGYGWTDHAWHQRATRGIPFDAVTAALHAPPVVRTPFRGYHVWRPPARARILVVCVAYHPARILTCFWRNAQAPLPLARWRGTPRGHRLRRRPRVRRHPRPSRAQHPPWPRRVRIVQARFAFRLDPPARPGPWMPHSDSR